MLYLYDSTINTQHVVVRTELFVVTLLSRAGGGGGEGWNACHAERTP